MIVINYPEPTLPQIAATFVEVKGFYGLTDRQAALLDDCDDLHWIVKHWRVREYGACTALLRFHLIIRW